MISIYLFILFVCTVAKADVSIPSDSTGAANWQGYITGTPGTTYRVFFFFLSLFFPFSFFS
jgi:hypothetical protein